MINIIVAASTNLVIGKDNDIPWNLPTDMKHFKDVTTGHKVIMGRKCWESIPEKFRPLPNRKNYVLTRNTDYVANGATVVHDFDSIIEKYKSTNEELFVIGGSDLYEEAFQHADKLFFTQIYSKVEGDTYLKGLVLKEWELIDGSKILEENELKFRFEVYVKKQR
jgi:dihydrofolate reductase